MFLAVTLINVLICGAFLGSINSPESYAHPAWYLDQVVLGMVFAGVGAVGFVFLSMVIRCPVCRKNVGWHVLSTEDASKWFKTLISLDRCPFC